MIQLDLNGISNFIGDCAVAPDKAAAATAQMRAHPMSGWLRLPQKEWWKSPDAERIRNEARRIQGHAKTLIVVGAGGSSLGARALIDALGFDKLRVLFTGDNLSESYAWRISRILDRCADDYEGVHVIVSSKSGTTLETLLSLRFLMQRLLGRYGDGSFGDDAYKRLTVITEPKKSPLRVFAEEHGCETFEIPENVGGRYSVLTACGLLPAAFAGADIEAVMEGAYEQAEAGLDAAVTLAGARNALYDAGFHNEIFATFEPQLERFGQWWRQLFGESEGKHGGGSFPSTVTFTGDLHSMGQYIQDGRRDVYETVVSFGDGGPKVGPVPPGEFPDGLDALTGKSFHEINELARAAVESAHIAGGVPVAGVRLPSPCNPAIGLGALMYFFETVCALSCFLRGVDPFDQPGVEEYKVRVKKSLGI